MTCRTRGRKVAGRRYSSPGNNYDRTKRDIRPVKGFTLVELLTVIAIMGILSAVAIPAFIAYLQRAKTSEAQSNVQKIYSGSVTYYDTEHVERGMHADTIVARQLPCSDGTSLWCPGAPPSSKRFEASPPCFYNNLPLQGRIWKALDFAIADHHYYRYQYVCTRFLSNPPGDNAFIGRAQGDLDGDGIRSIFERSGYVGPGDIVIGGAGIFMVNPLE